MSISFSSTTFDRIKLHKSPDLYSGNNVTPERISLKPLQPEKDIVEKKDKPDKKQRRRAVVATIAAAIGALWCVKKLQVKNIKNIQRTFQDVFMRNDISVEESRAILERYKEIEKIKDNKEYARALFAEAKKNFGLQKTPIELVFEAKEGANGFCCRDNSKISLTPDCSRSHMLNTIHHEFRHAKQHSIAYHAYPDMALRYVLAGLQEQFTRKAADIITSGEVEGVDAIFRQATEELRPQIMERIDEQFGEIDMSKVPSKYTNFAEDCKNGIDHYVDLKEDFAAYFDNFTEVDARKAGAKMDKYTKGKAFTFNWLDELLQKPVHRILGD